MSESINSKGLWNSLFSNPRFVVFVINSDGLILDINHTEVSMNKDEIIGKLRIQDFYPEADKEIPLRSLNEIFIQNKTSSHYDYFNKEEKKYFSNVMMPVLEKDKVIAATVIANDVTEEKQLQESLIKTAKLASIGELASGVAHEVNNPLMIINFVFENLERLSFSDEKQKVQFLDLCSKGKDGVDRISKIVSSLAKYSRLDHQLSSISLNKCVLDSIQMFSNIYQKQGIDIQIELSKQDDYIKGDEGKIHQIISNLLSNAKDALVNINEPRITIKTLVTEKEVSLIVFDNGKGIEPESINKIFESFYTTKEVGKGTGLGLSVVKNLVEEMNGKLTAKSSKVGQTEFKTSFPVCEKLNVLNENLSGLNVKEINSIGRVMVVDDESDITFFLNKALTNLGIENIVVTDPLKAFEILKEESFDVLIVDYAMPNMNGLDLIRKVKKENLGTKKFIILSGYIDLDQVISVEEFKECHLSLVRKPINTQTLIDELNKISKKA